MRKGTRNTLGALASVGIIAGCDSGYTNEYVEGEVSGFFGTLPTLMRSPGFDGLVSYSSETVKFGNPTFGFYFVDDGGSEYTISIGKEIDSFNPAMHGPKTIQTVAARILRDQEQGKPTLVKILAKSKQNNCGDGCARVYITSDRQGEVDPDLVTFLN